MIARMDRATVVGFGVVAVSMVLYWLSNRVYDAARGDFFYLADAFLHGRPWLDVQLGPWDVIPVDGRYYVPFAPFPAVALMPLVAVVGAVRADQLEPGINAMLAASGVGLCWWLLGRIGVGRLIDRLWLVILFGFSTQILWVTTRGGVWHTGHLIATILTLACLIELWGKRRAGLIGLLGGFAFLTRAPLAFAMPFYAFMLLEPSGRQLVADVAGGYIARARTSIPWRSWTLLTLGFLPSLLAFFFYNQVRFDDPFESGYALATLPEWLEAQRQKGLFGLVHVPMNIDYFLLHLAIPISEPPFFKPDGFGMSVLVTSPGLFSALRADWRQRRSWWMAGATIAVLIPTLLYYGGGWFQYGYRYFLDSVPFVMALCALAAVHRGPNGVGWKVAIVFGTIGVYWASRL